MLRVLTPNCSLQPMRAVLQDQPHVVKQPRSEMEKLFVEWWLTGLVYRMPDRRTWPERRSIVSGGRRIDDPLYDPPATLDVETDES